MTGRHDLPEIEAMLVAAEPAPTLRQVRCGWCEGTGNVPDWEGWAHRGTKPCVRCAGRGIIVVEEGCYD